jgi:next-to-BRCA1 protein 1
MVLLLQVNPLLYPSHTPPHHQPTKQQKCIDCPDFDSCASCYAIVPTQHPRHSFARLREPKDLETYPVPRPAHRATCNECGSAIQGIRYKCMHPACNDFDLCAGCEALPIPVHPTTHAMLKIREPAAHVPVVERYEVPRAPIVEHTGVAIVEGDWP